MKIATFYDHILDIARQEDIKLSEALKLAKEAGIDCLEVSTGNVETAGAQEIKAQLDAAGITVSSLCAYFQFDRHDDLQAADLQQLVNAQKLGTEKMLVIPGFWSAGDTDAEKERKTESIKTALNRLADKAKDYGITLMMEDFDSADSPYATIDGLKGFLEDVPELYCGFDTGNFLFSGEDAVKAYEVMKDKTIHVHLKDRALASLPGSGKPVEAVDGRLLYTCPVGGGSIQMQEIINRLKADGYDGVLTMEHYGSEAQLSFLRQSVKWLQSVW